MIGHPDQDRDVPKIWVICFEYTCEHARSNIPLLPYPPTMELSYPSNEVHVPYVNVLF